MTMNAGRWASLALIGTALSAALGGCCASGLKDSRVSISPEIDGDIKLRGLNAGRAENGHAMVDAEIGNCERHVEQFQYRVTWVDSSGLAVDSLNSNWTTATLSPKGTERIRLVSPIASAENFKLELIDVENEDRLLWWPFNYFFGRR